MKTTHNINEIFCLHTEQIVHNENIHSHLSVFMQKQCNLISKVTSMKNYQISLSSLKYLNQSHPCI